MIEQTVNPQASVAGLKGLGTKGGKTATAGLFAKFMAAFQAQIKQGSKSSSLLSQAIKEAGTQGEGVAHLAVAKKGVAGSTVEAKASAMIASKWNRAEVSESDGTASTMESLIAAGSGKAKPDKELKDELFSHFKAGQIQHEAKQNSINSTEEEAIAVAGLVEPLVLQNQKEVNKESALHRSAESESDESGKNVAKHLFAASNQSKMGVADKSQKLLVEAGSPGASRPVIEDLTADEWLAGHVRKPVAMELTGKAVRASTGEAGVSDKGSRFVDVGSKADAFSEAVKAGANRAEGFKQAQPAQASGQTGSTVLADSDLQEQNISRGGLQQPGVQAADRTARTHQESASVRQDQAEPVVNVAAQARGRAPSHFQQLHASQPQAGAVEKFSAQGNEFGSGTSQQDLNSGSQQSDTLLADSSKLDSKGARGADFASQLHYRTAQVYKPAEAMIEIARSAKDGSMKLEMQLEPAHLGKVQVTLQSDAGKQLQVHIAVDQAASRQVIEQHLPQLRAALAEQGLDLGHFSMDMNSQGGQEGTGRPESGAFSEFAINGNTVEGSSESVTRLGVNRADSGHISILA